MIEMKKEVLKTKRCWPMLWDGPKKRDRTRSKSRLAQCGVKDPTKTGLAQSSKMSGQALHAWSLAGGSVAICSAASAPTYSRWFQLKSDQLPRAVAKPTSLYNNI